MIAFGGVICGLAIAVLFLSGLFPMLDYTLPAISGILLISMVIEYGYKSALLCYAAVAVLSLLLVPNKEVALLFAGFFGFLSHSEGQIGAAQKTAAGMAVQILDF